jgi:4'-phosphopantetheinyl transferase
MDMSPNGGAPLPSPQALDPLQVHLWHAFVPEQDVGRFAANYLDMLTAQEREQHRRFRFARDRDRYLVTRALIRTVLTLYAPVEARDWRFETNAYGRPQIANDKLLARRIRFNISHSDSLVVIAIGVDRDIGVDVENTQRDAPLEVADRFFSHQEVLSLRQLPTFEQPQRFWDLWTLKESYIKARGMGLSLPLGKFSFSFDHGTDMAIAFEDGFGDSPDSWVFFQLRPNANHLVSLCLARTCASLVELTCFRFAPPSHVAIFPSMITRCSRNAAL